LGGHRLHADSIARFVEFRPVKIAAKTSEIVGSAGQAREANANLSASILL
jgi:hypothetical protein